ncbi:MAG: phospholipase D family protein [Flavobacteriaceae bacterium]
MAEFLTTSGISYNIENIIVGAKKKLVLVSPYLKISKNFYERLKDVTHRDVIVKIIYGKDELKEDEKKQLLSLKNVELYFSQNLHAKCYFNETKMVITSMNMYEFSEKNNREMGVLIDRKEDEELFNKAVFETESIFRSSEKKYPTDNSITQEIKKTINVAFNKISNKSSFPITVSKPPKKGYCIRCEKQIKYNPHEPYCSSCYNVWANFSNPFYEEICCHRCGEYEYSTMEKPQCYDCYIKYISE